jgi:hypothetical protein
VNISAKHTWDKLRECWIDTYLGPPDQIAHDAGKNFVSKEFQQYARTVGTVTKSVPVETHHSIGIVERYHGPVRRAYQIASEELPDLDRDAALQMAFKAINDTAGPDGIVPTLLVFGAYPRLVESDAPSPTVSHRATVLKKAMEEVRKLRAKRQVNDALNQRNGPSTSAIKDLPLNSDVLVWCETPDNKTGRWTGPFTLLGTDKEDCIVALPSGPTTFRSTVVKPYFTDEKDQEGQMGNPQQDQLEPKSPTVVDQSAEFHPSGGENQSNPPTTEPIRRRRGRPRKLPTDYTPQTTVQPPIHPKRGRGRPRKVPPPSADANVTDIEIYIGAITDTQFVHSRQKEVNGLIDKGVFQLVHKTDIPQGIRIFNSRFVEAVAATFPEYSVYLRDITQAYTQSTTTLNRDFYTTPPKGVTQWEGFYLKVVKPLYGVPEAGNHWFGTYQKHHIDNLRMTQSTYDPCLMYSTTASFGLVGLQTDDTLIVADDTFAKAEEEELQKAGFMAKKREQLTEGNTLKFNGGNITLQSDNSITMTQESYNTTLQTVTTIADLVSSRGTVRRDVAVKDQYVAQRARGAYLATVTQPEAAFDLSFAAQTTGEITQKQIDLLNKRIQWQKENCGRGLRFVKLSQRHLRLITFTDAAFANNADLSSQIGYVIVLADQDNANIIHWSSTKCKRVTRSVLASELYAMSNALDIASAIKSTIEKILRISLPLTICTDSKSLYDCLVKLGTTQEKRLMVDLMCLRQSYERREIAEVKWIDGNTNPADAMTKSKACSALKDLVDTNKVNITYNEWVER